MKGCSPHYLGCLTIPSTGKTAPLYGMVGELSGKGTIDEMLKELLDAMNKPQK